MSAARTIVGAFLGAVSAPFAYAAVFGLTGAPAAGWAAAAIAAAVAIAFARRRLRLDTSACPRSLRVVAALASLLAVVEVGRLAVYMVDPSEVGYSWVPGSRWEVQHSCLSAYYVAGRQVATTPNVYDPRLYSLPGAPNTPRVARKLGPFNVDVYEYPPPFLLLPRLLGLATGDFVRVRALWFGLTGAMLLVGMVCVAGTLGPGAGTRALLLGPLVWTSPSTLSTLQKGNVQVIVVAGAMLAMLLFERGRRAAGGALLAFLYLAFLRHLPGLFGGGARGLDLLAGRGGGDGLGRGAIAT